MTTAFHVSAAQPAARVSSIKALPLPPLLPLSPLLPFLFLPAGRPHVHLPSMLLFFFSFFFDPPRTALKTRLGVSEGGSIQGLYDLGIVFSSATSQPSCTICKIPQFLASFFEACLVGLFVDMMYEDPTRHSRYGVLFLLALLAPSLWWIFNCLLESFSL